ncbi:MAG TPA: response regulator [Geobacteraceae bacterium]
MTRNRGVVVEDRKQIGKLLVDAGIISLKTLERVLILQKKSGKRLGELLGEMGIVTEEEIAEAVASQFNLKTVKKFADHPFPKELLDLVPARMALERAIFPLKVHEKTLAIATSDPADRETLTQLADKTGMRIYPVLSTREEILAAVEKHYRIEKDEQEHGQRILLVDDSPLFVNLLSPSLTREGYEVLLAGDGIEGLKMALVHHPDLILCDLFLPRMNGYSFLLAVREHSELAGVPVILVTSKASMEEEEKALKAGFVDFIGKPVMPAKVIARIRSALSADGSEPGSTGNDYQEESAARSVCRAPSQRREGMSRADGRSSRTKRG